MSRVIPVQDRFYSHRIQQLHEWLNSEILWHHMDPKKYCKMGAVFDRIKEGGDYIIESSAPPAQIIPVSAVDKIMNMSLYHCNGRRVDRKVLTEKVIAVIKMSDGLKNEGIYGMKRYVFMYIFIVYIIDIFEIAVSLVRWGSVYL